MDLSRQGSNNQFVFEAQLEEYRMLRTEILHRLDFQFRVTNYAVVLFAGLMTVIAAIIGRGALERNWYFILLIIPWIFYVFALAYREQDFMIMTIATYLNTELKSKIGTLNVKSDLIFGWEEFFRLKTKWSPIDIIRGNSRYIFFFIPNLVFLIIFYYLVAGSEWMIYEKILFMINILMFIDPILGIPSAHKKYEKIFKKTI